MRKKPLTIGDRVDILLREGVDNPQAWMPLKAYDPDLTNCVGGDAWSEEWARLSEHHYTETEFLLNVIRELVKRYDLLDDQFASSMVDPSMEDD